MALLLRVTPAHRAATNLLQAGSRPMLEYARVTAGEWGSKVRSRLRYVVDHHAFSPPDQRVPAKQRRVPRLAKMDHARVDDRHIRDSSCRQVREQVSIGGFGIELPRRKALEPPLRGTVDQLPACQCERRRQGHRLRGLAVAPCAGNELTKITQR